MRIYLISLSIILIIISVVFIVGNIFTFPNQLTYEGRFVVVENNFNYKIYADTQTQVLYWSNGNGGGIAPLLNTDGSLALYEGVLPR